MCRPAGVLISRAALAAFLLAALSKAEPMPPQPLSIFKYIHNTWSVLTRSHHDLASAAVDPKFLLRPAADGPC